MLAKLVELSLRYKLLVLCGFAVIIFLGVRAYDLVPVDAFPDVTPLQVNIYAESPGLAAEDVETLLTIPVETAMAGLPGVEQIRSVSLFGLSYVAVYFKDDVDIYFARRLASEKLAEAKDRIPAGYGEPQLGPNSSGMGQVLWYVLESPPGGASPMDLRTVQDWSVRLLLRTAPGVDDVTSWGGFEKQFQVLVDPRKLASFGLSFRELIEALTVNNKQVGGQYIDRGSEQFLVRGLGRVGSAAEIGNIVVATHENTPIFVRDIADVKEGPGLRIGAVTKDGHEVVLGIALQRFGENAAAVVSSVKQKLDTVQKALPKGVRLTTVYDRTDLVKKAVGTAERALIEGSVLVAIVLFLFLGDLRSAVVVILALPLAMLIAFILMQQFGLSANLMSLAGLAVGIGMMVDGAVVMVENGYRLLNHAGPEADRSGVIGQAAREVANPIAFAILIIIVVFLPLFALTQLEGKLFKPMALTITFAMVGSLVLTMTLIPVLSALILRPRGEADTFLLRTAKRAYLPLLDAALARKALALGLAGGLLVVSLALFPLLGREFMPQLQEGTLLFRVTGIASTSLDESIRVSTEIDRIVKTYPQVTSTFATIGRAERGETTDVNYIEFSVILKPIEEWPEQKSFQTLASEMRERIEHEVGTVVVASSQPIQMRVEELISGVRATLALKLYGENLATLDRLSGELKAVLAKISGVTDLSLEANKGKPQLAIRADREAMARYGVNASELMDVVRAGIGGENAGLVIEGARRFNIQVWLAPDFRRDVAAIEAIPIHTKGGALVPLARIARIELDDGYSFVRREQLQRYAVIQMDVRGRDVGGFVAEANAAISKEVSLPAGYYIEWGGSFENQQRALQRLSLIVPLTIGLIFVLLYTAFNSVTHAALIIANVPFALIGGIVGLFITGQYLSVPSAIGFIAVFGVAMLNGIVLVAFMNEQRTKFGRSVTEAVREAAALRLRPVLMTASVAILGLVPMLLSHGVGAETQRPLATVVVGGLFTSTALTLLLLPLMYEWVEERRERRDLARPQAARETPAE